VFISGKVSSVQVLKLYDPARKPTEWTGLIHAGQFAVFHSDIATDVERDSDGHYLQLGEDSTCLVFDSLTEAEGYCEAKVEEISSLRCDIYDHTGKSKPPMLTYVNKVHLHAPVKTREVGMGAGGRQLAFLLECVGSSWDARHTHDCWGQSGIRRLAHGVLERWRHGKAALSTKEINLAANLNESNELKLKFVHLRG
jgi:hypothetical protein